MNAVYFDPTANTSVTADVDSSETLISLLEHLSRLRSERGRPTLELVRDGGSSLALSTDGDRAFLVWTDSLGESFHSVGGTPGPRFRLLRILERSPQ